MTEDEEESEDEVYSRTLSRRINPWIFAMVGTEFAKNVCRSAAVALDDLVTVFGQQFNWTENRKLMIEQAHMDIESITEGAFDATSGEAGGDQRTGSVRPPD